LGLNSDYIGVVNDITHIPYVLININLICSYNNVKGDFETNLSLYPQNTLTEKIINKIGSDDIIAVRFVDYLNCKCIIPKSYNKRNYLGDNSSYILFEPNSIPKDVEIDEDETIDDVWLLVK
jgi:hypothetical protein